MESEAILLIILGVFFSFLTCAFLSGFLDKCRQGKVPQQTAQVAQESCERNSDQTSVVLAMGPPSYTEIYLDYNDPPPSYENLIKVLLTTSLREVKDDNNSPKIPRSTTSSI